MGGAGAKERRRMQRLHRQNPLQNDGDDAKHLSCGSTNGTKNGQYTIVKQSDQKLHTVDSHNNTSKQTPMDRRGRGGNQRSLPSPLKGRISNLSNNVAGKFKKPKHLKRKLEQIRTCPEPADFVSHVKEEDILRQMEKWEEQKQRKKHQITEQTTSGSDRSRDKHEQRLKRSRITASSDGAVQNSFTTMDTNDTLQTNTAPNDFIETSKSVTNNVELKAPHVLLEQNDDGDNDGDEKVGEQSESDSEDSVQPVSDKRQRGKRRRGRRDTSSSMTLVTEESHVVDTETEDPKMTENIQSETVRDIEPIDDRKKDREEPKSAQRYCIGRKPVTDFVIGQSYNGTVVYVKQFGIFLDIGCHSDAFCHVSRLRDDFVESPEKLFKTGDSVPNVRIIEIDRSQKRITVSLQSTAMVEHEEASIECRKRRRAKQPNKKRQETKTNRAVKEDQLGKSATLISSQKDAGAKRTNYSEVDAIGRKVPKEKRHHMEGTQLERVKTSTTPESEMTPTELKRARKLARRATRRAANEEKTHQETASG